MREQLFAGLCLCSTGLEPPVMEQVRKIVLACGGVFMDDFDTSKATHLIAEAVGSLKHRTAVAHDLPVASPRWVFESFRAQKLLDVKDFSLRVLEGLVVCTAGLPMEEKESVAALATTHGAQYESRLESGFTNVLIAQRPEGAKYEAAVANDIPVVHVAWLYACLERQILADEEEFVLRPESESDKMQPTHIAAKLRQDAQELVADLPQIVKRYRRSQREENAELESQSTGADEEDSDDDWIDLFDGCVLYLLGFSPQMKTVLQRLIRTGMGTIYDNMVVRQVTHVLVSASLSDRQTLETIQARVMHANAEGEVHFVSAQWLLDCVKSQHLEPEELYPVEFDVHGPETSTGNVDAAQSFRDVPVPQLPVEVVQVEVNPISSMVSEDLLENRDGENMLKEVETNLTPETKRKSKLFPGYAFLLLCRDPEDEFLIKPMLQSLRGRHGGAEALALASSDFPHVDPEQFAFVTHAVMCCGAVLDEQAALTMQQRIHDVQRKNNSGECEVGEPDGRSRKRARHNASPEKKKPRRHTLRFVSDLWVNCCLAARKRLAYDCHELFVTSLQRPHPLFATALPLPAFRSVLASTTVYMDVDRLVIIELLKLAGAQVTSKLSKRNTHLICPKPFGMKYDKATEWGLSVVTARWVVDSLLRGERLDEASPDFQVIEHNEHARSPHSESQETNLSTSSHH